MADSITDELAGIADPRARASTKAQRLVERLTAVLDGGKAFTFSVGKGQQMVTITVSEIVFDGYAVSCHCEAKDKKGPLPVDNPYLFLNPPILAPTGGTVTETDPETGETIIVEVVAENPIEAAKSMVADAVLYVARKQGWSG